MVGLIQMKCYISHQQMRLPQLLQNASNVMFLFFIRYVFKMRHHSLLCLFALVTLFGHNDVLSLAPSYGERGSDLGIQVFKDVVHSNPMGNVVLSPHGVASILGMLLPGANGETLRQLLGALRYKKNGKDFF